MNRAEDWLQRLKDRPLPPGSWQALRRDQALAALLQATSLEHWLTLSGDYNGFVREAAVRQLRNHPSPQALIALIERLNDWVVQVRELAATAVQHYLTVEHTPSLLIALEHLIALAARSRTDHGPTLSAARTVLQAPQVREQVHAHFLIRQGKAARYLFALLLECEAEPASLLRDALAHPELTVRLLAIDACQSLPAEQARPLLHQALTCPGAKVRVKVLRALLPLLDDPHALLRQSLLDASPAIRNLAQWAAPRHGLTASTVLAERLHSPLPERRRDWLGVLGLAAELQQPLPPHWLAAALHSPWPSVRQAAIGHLHEPDTGALFDALADPSYKVFCAAVSRLGPMPWSLLQAPLDALLDRDWHNLPEVRRQALFWLRPTWQQAAYLLQRWQHEPQQQAFWLRQIDQWCDGQYGIVDPVTPRQDRARILEHLKALGEAGLIRCEGVRRVS